MKFCGHNEYNRKFIIPVFAKCNPLIPVADLFRKHVGYECDFFVDLDSGDNTSVLASYVLKMSDY